MTPFLTDAEIADICAGLQQPAAMVRYLRALGITVATKPNGRPLVVRSHAEAVLSGCPAASAQAAAPAAQSVPERLTHPNRAALIEVIGGRRAPPPPQQPAQSAATRLRT